MASFSREFLSGSVNGLVIPVVATATPGTLLHTAVDGDGAFDEVYLWAANITGTPATLTLEWGGVVDPTNHLFKTVTIAPNALPIAIAIGQVLNGGLLVRAFSGTANAINISGYVNRIQ